MLRENLERELQNWALWRTGGGWLDVWNSCNISPVYEPESVRNRESKVPVLAGAATDVDSIVALLDPAWRTALYAEYLQLDRYGRRIPASFSQARTAQHLHLSERTYKRNLDEARNAVGDRLSDKRRRRERVALAGGS